MTPRYVPALNGTHFLGMVENGGTSENHYVKAAEYDKLESEVLALKHDIERHMKVTTEQLVEIEHLRNLLRSVGFGEL